MLVRNFYCVDVPIIIILIRHILTNYRRLNYNHMQQRKDNFLPLSGDSILGNAPDSALSGDGGSNPTSPLQSKTEKKLVRAVNACDVEFHETRVPSHEYSSVCFCPACRDRSNVSNLQQGLFDNQTIEEIKYDNYEAKQLRFRSIYESEARRFIAAQHYLKRWFVGATLCFGAFTPENSLLVGAAALSAPAAHSKRFTARNTKEVRRFRMLDCCGRNSESRFISWILRESKKLCPHLRYIITFGNPKYDKETPYRAAGFRCDGRVDCSAQWISHGSHRAREAKDDKLRYVYIYRS